jgi:hypothetical protein
VHAASTPIDSVELWIAYGVCELPDGTPCDGIGWPGTTTRPSGEVLTLGADEKLFRTDKIVDGVAQFHLETVPGKEKPFAIIVVGYSGSSVVGVKLMSPVEIPTDDQARWLIELRDAAPATDDITADPGEGTPYAARVWARKPSATLPDATGYTGCLAYQKWTGTEWETLYIVPDSDPDCDGNPPDCNPYWYEASVSNARCVTVTGSLSDVCVVGAATCRSETDQGSCSPLSQPQICVPSEVCSSCKDSADLAACIKTEISTNLMTNMVTVPIQKCPMVTDLDGPCTNNASLGGWTASFQVRAGVCAPKVAAGPIAVIRSSGAYFSGGSTTSTLTNANITVHAAPEGGGGCNIDVTWTSGAQPIGLVPIVLAVAYGPSNEILLPVILDFSKPANQVCPATTTPAPCVQAGNWPTQLIRGDSMFDCAL